MRLLLLTFYYPPDICAGSFRMGGLVEALQEIMPAEDHLTILTTEPNRYSTFTAVAEPVEEHSDQIRVERLPVGTHQSGLLDQSLAFRRFAEAASSRAAALRFDAVFATSSRLMTAALGARIARRAGVPLYLDIRDLFTDTLSAVHPWTSRLLHPALDLIEKKTFRQARVINIVSPGYREYLALKAPQAKITEFTNGVDEIFTQSLPPRSEPSARRLRILYAGNIGEGQGLHRLVPAAAPLLSEQAEIRIIGAGGCRMILERRLMAGGITNVTLLAPMTQKALLQEYSNADILLLHLNDYQVFHRVLPSKLFEYGALGKPIVAGVAGYARGFILKYLPDARTFDPCDVNGFVTATRQISLGQRSREEFIDRFSRKRIMAGLAREIMTSLR